MLNKTKRDAISSQVLDEIQFARDAKRPILDKWHLNEDLYYSNKKIIAQMG